MAIKKYGTFSGASLEICVSQSSLSQQIHKLEEELGVKLFIRGSRVARLTPAGEEFSNYAQRIMTEIQNSRESMQEYTNFNKGHIKIGAIPTIGYLGFHRTIASFMQIYPGIQVELYEANTDDLLQWLHQKKINTAFITFPYMNDFNVDFYPLMDDKIVVLVSSEHPLADQSVIDLNDLTNEKFLMIKSSSGWRNSLVHACHECGFSPTVILDTSSVELLRSFVEEGIGVALMGHRIAQQVSTKLTSIVQLNQSMKRQNGLAILPDNRLPLATKLFRDFAIKYASSATSG